MARIAKFSIDLSSSPAGGSFKGGGIVYTDGKGMASAVFTIGEGGKYQIKAEAVNNKELLSPDHVVFNEVGHKIEIDAIPNVLTANGFSPSKLIARIADTYTSHNILVKIDSGGGCYVPV
jgi:hypothetical protein